MGFAPRAAMFLATFAAPPSRISLLVMDIIGTGASGDIRSTFPHMYESIITSPTIRALSPENLSKISSKDFKYFYFKCANASLICASADTKFSSEAA